MAGEQRFTMFHFSQSNPIGAGQGDVPALLRRVADAIDELGTVTVHDLVLHASLLDAEERPTITVYYDEP